MKPYCVFGTKIIPLERAGLALNDLGVLRGYGVFDFLRTYNGKPFLFEEHWRRFCASAKLLGLSVPVSGVKARSLIEALLKKNGNKEASIRLVLTGGVALQGMHPSRPVFYILEEPLYQFPPSVFRKGAALITEEYMRLFPSAKTTNYIRAVALQKKKRAARAVEILYISDGLVYEGATSSLFLVSRGTLITPVEGVLPGITRTLVIRLAKKRDIPVVMRPIRVRELWGAEEIFLTATNKDVTPVVTIDGRSVGGGKPGPITLALLEDYRSFTQEY